METITNNSIQRSVFEPIAKTSYCFIQEKTPSDLEKVESDVEFGAIRQSENPVMPFDFNAHKTVYDLIAKYVVRQT